MRPQDKPTEKRAKKRAVSDRSAFKRLFQMPPHRANAWVARMSRRVVLCVTDSTRLGLNLTWLEHRHPDWTPDRFDDTVDTFVAVHDAPDTRLRVSGQADDDAVNALEPLERQLLATVRAGRDADGEAYAIVTDQADVWRRIPGLEIIPFDDSDPADTEDVTTDHAAQVDTTLWPFELTDDADPPTDGPALRLMDGGLARDDAAESPSSPQIQPARPRRTAHGP